MTSDPHASLAQLRALLQAHGGDHVLTALGAAAARDDEDAREHDAAETRRALAVFDTAFLATAADGVLSDEEIEELATLLSAVTDGEATDEDLGYLLENFSIALEQEGLEARLSNIADALDSPDARRLAFIAACGVSLLASRSSSSAEGAAYRESGKLETESRAMLDRIAETLSISQHDAAGWLQEIEARLGA
jgi:hypothetical protein